MRRSASSDLHKKYHHRPCAGDSQMWAPSHHDDRTVGICKISVLSRKVLVKHHACQLQLTSDEAQVYILSVTLSAMVGTRGTLWQRAEGFRTSLVSVILRRNAVRSSEACEQRTSTAVSTLCFSGK